MGEKTKDKCRSPMINRRRFLHGVAWMNGAIATGVSSWSIQSDWANAAAAPIKVGIATDPSKVPMPPSMIARKPWMRKRMPRSAKSENTGTTSAPASPARAVPKLKVTA